MALKLYNTLTKKKEEFTPINPGKVGMYVCGPTVYDHCHLGHARGYVSMDVLRHYLEYSGYEVRHIMNYTDVGHLVADAEIGEDKIEKKAKTEKLDPMEIANTYIESCEEDFSALNIQPAHFNPRPTKYIVQIIKFVEELIKKDYAYAVNGSVYFSVDKFPDYGKLSGKKKDDLISGSRVEINPEKKNPLDFAVWIKAPKEHILKWESPWGVGYPGWHIECSVMSNDLLGQDTFDIHGGGNENAFPHNENEIAQSECYLGKKMANFWILWNMVTVDGVKASKSLGNAMSIKDALKKFDPAVIRLWIISSHYRSITNYTDEALEQAKVNLNRIADFVQNLKSVAVGPLQTGLNPWLERFEKAMNDDLNTPLALSVVYELITETNKLIAENKLGAEDAKQILATWEKMNRVFGLIIKKEDFKTLPPEISSLFKEREKAKLRKDFAKSDKLRTEIEKLGYIINDDKNSYDYKIVENGRKMIVKYKVKIKKK
ncbi:MAG: cysteine--tRNA ligase [Parcubacteria group bacterium]